MTSANVFRKIHHENTKFMMKLDAYENSLKYVHPVCVNKNDKLTALVTLKEQPSILDNLFLYEKPDIEALKKLINSIRPITNL
jgi:hypothetical protein